MIAENYIGFVGIVSDSIITGLNNPIGQQITEELLRMKLAENPGLSVAEWKRTKAEFVMFLFVELMKEEELMSEFAHHVWKELRME